MTKKTKDYAELILGIVISVIALFAIKSFFQDDSGSIVSNRGAKVLESEDLMKKVEKEIETSRQNLNEGNKEVFIDID